MKVVLLSLVALLCYSISSVLMKHKIPTGYSVSMIQCISYVLMLTLALLTRLREVRNAAPDLNSKLSWMIFIVIISAGLLYFIADYCYFSALTENGSIVVIMVILALIPCITGIIELPFTKKAPHWLEIVGIVLGVLAVYCVTKGSQLKALAESVN